MTVEPAESATLTFRVGDETTDVDGVIVVVFEDEVSGIEATLTGISYEVLLTTEQVPHATIELEHDTQTADALERFRDRDDVDSAYREQQAETASHETFDANDPRYQDGDQWAPDAVHLPGAWQETMATDRSIAIVDTGVSDHDDLDHCYTWTPSNIASDPEHGTKTAGTAAAQTDNDEGIAAASDACIRNYPAKLRGNGVPPTLTSSATATAILATVADDVDVVQTAILTENTPLLRAAVATAQDNDVPVVAAAGNQERPCSSNYPANYPEPIEVGGMNSSEGAPQCDGEIHAPSVSVATTTDGGYTLDATGTSFGSPMVAGTIALAKSAGGDISSATAAGCVTGNTDEMEMADEVHLNASAAVEDALDGAC